MNSLYRLYTEGEIEKLRAQFRPYYTQLSGLDFQIDRCEEALFHRLSVSALTEYVANIIERARAGDRIAAEESLYVALPIVYRLALDDTSRELRFAATIQDVACRVLRPELHRALCQVMATESQGALGLSDAEVVGILPDVLDVTKTLGTTVCPECRVYGRIKTPVSIFLKLYRYLTRIKVPKGRPPSDFDGVQRAAAVLARVDGRLSGRIDREPTLDGPSLEYLFPDFIGVSIHYDDTFVKGGHLSRAQRRYRRIEAAMAQCETLRMRAGPFRSRHWHMKRLAFHVRYVVGPRVSVPVEILVRTNRDYLLGYANYWRYKGAVMLEVPGSEEGIARKRLLRRLRGYRDIGSVQEMLLRDVQELLHRSRQPSLF